MTFLQNIDPNIVIAVVTGVGGYLTARYQSKQDIKKNYENFELERAKMFSQDQEEFRTTLMEEFRRSREQLSLIQEHNDSLTIQNVDLRRKILDLQTHNNELLIQLNEMRSVNNELLERVRGLEESREEET